MAAPPNNRQTKLLAESYLLVCINTSFSMASESSKSSRQDKRLEIAEASKILLGVEVLNRAIDHLGKAKKTLEIELSQIGDTTTKDLLKSQQQSQQEIDRIHQRQTEIAQEIANFDRIKQEIGQHLLELTAATAIQAQRQELESTKATHQTQLRQAQSTIKQIVSTPSLYRLTASANSRLPAACR